MNVMNVDLPDYRRKAYFKGDYSEFKYHTQFLKERERICFLSGQTRSKGGATKFEMEYKKESDPRLGPGCYTPLAPSFSAKQEERRKTLRQSIFKKEVSEESILSIDSKELTRGILPSKIEKKKDMTVKDGLMWSKRDDVKDLQVKPGPADTSIQRYPECLAIKPNKAPFNKSSVFKQPLTITTIAPKSSADQYEHKDLFKSAFQSKKELDVPIIICVRSYKDSCAKCKNQIYENYFYIKGSVFVCRKCYKDSIKSKSVHEQIKMSMFKQGRYCTRYHRHHKVRGFDTLIPNKYLYHLLIKELYLQQYTGGRFIDEGIPSKNKAKTSTKGSKIYQSLFSDSTYNEKEVCIKEFVKEYPAEAFARTFGSVREFEASSGMRHECLICRPTPAFIFPHTCPNRAIFSMA